MALDRGLFSDSYWENKEARCSSAVPVDLKYAAYIMQWMEGTVWRKLRMLAVKVMKLGTVKAVRPVSETG
jgi:hypothetical protein